MIRNLLAKAYSEYQRSKEAKRVTNAENRHKLKNYRVKNKRVEKQKSNIQLVQVLIGIITINSFSQAQLLKYTETEYFLASLMPIPCSKVNKAQQ